jgi:hypothetical protein
MRLAIRRQAARVMEGASIRLRTVGSIQARQIRTTAMDITRTGGLLTATGSTSFAKR